MRVSWDWALLVGAGGRPWTSGEGTSQSPRKPPRSLLKLCSASSPPPVTGRGAPAACFSLVVRPGGLGQTLAPGLGVCPHRGVPSCPGGPAVFPLLAGVHSGGSWAQDAGAAGHQQTGSFLSPRRRVWGLLPLLTGGALALWSPSAGAGPILQPRAPEGHLLEGVGWHRLFPAPPPAPWPDARSFQGVTLLRGLLLSALLGKTLGEIYSEFMALAAVLWSKEGQEGTVLGCRTTCSSPSSRPPAPPSGPDRPDEVREARLVF